MQTVNTQAANVQTPSVAAARRDCNLLSVVVPCYNEAEALHSTHTRLLDVLSHVAPDRFELIYVDDGSWDGTRAILRDFHSSNRYVRVIGLSRNFGHQFAVSAGLDSARGDVVVLIDADLQDPPEVIGAMLERWRAGADVVYGVREAREGDGRFKRISASIFYRFLNRLSDIPIPLDTGDFRLMDRRVRDVLCAMPEQHRFVRGMVAWAGFRQEALFYVRAARVAGESKYPFSKMVRFAIDGVSSFSIRPLRLATWVGVAASMVALVVACYAVANRILTQDWVSGWTALFVAVSFLGGIQLLALGLIGEYVGRLFMQAKARPLYVVEECLDQTGPLGE
jgi:glycosyltransferase involved in cell wall biosynthesis